MPDNDSNLYLNLEFSIGIKATELDSGIDTL